MKSLFAIAILLFTNSCFGDFSYSLFDVPNSSSSPAWGINASGQIVGYATISGVDFGYIKNGSNYTLFSGPGGGDTDARGISNSGLIVGDYVDSNQKRIGFVRNGNAFSSFQVPGSIATFARAINNAGEIVGTYVNSSGRSFAYLYSQNVFTTLTPPSTTTNSSGFGINDSGVVVGGYTNATGDHGFKFSNGGFTTIDRPGGGTTLTGINNLGNLTGTSNVGGFYFDGATFTGVAFPQSGGTYPIAINDHNNLAGGYSRSGGSGVGGFFAQNLNAVPEPSSLLTAVAMSFAALIYRRRKQSIR